MSTDESLASLAAPVTLCKEVFDDNSEPTDKELLEYAEKIGIDISKEKHLLYIAREGLLAELPNGWKPCYDETLAAWFYYDFSNGETQWNHPLDDTFRDKVIKARAETFEAFNKTKAAVNNSDTEQTVDISKDDKVEDHDDNSEYKNVELAVEVDDNTEISTATNDILEQEHSSKNMLPLAPLAPIGGSSKALPPLKKLAPLGSIEKTPVGNIDLRPLGGINDKSLDKEKPSLDSPKKTTRPLKLGMGKSFLKTDSMESLDQKDNSDQASIRSTGSQKGILKTQPLQSNDALIRQAMMQREEKRIMFNLGANIEFASETEEDSEISSKSISIGQGKPSNIELNKEDSQEKPLVNAKLTPLFEPKVTQMYEDEDDGDILTEEVIEEEEEEENENKMKAETLFLFDAEELKTSDNKSSCYGKKEFEDIKRRADGVEDIEKDEDKKEVCGESETSASENSNGKVDLTTSSSEKVKLDFETEKGIDSSKKKLINNSMTTRNSLIKNFSKRMEQKQTLEVDNSTTETSSGSGPGFNEALKGVQFATEVLENVKDNKDNLSKDADLKPIAIDKEFQRLVRHERLKENNENLHEEMERLLDEKITQFKINWNEEKSREFDLLKQIFDKKIDDLQENYSKTQSSFQKDVLDSISKKRSPVGSSEENVLKELEEKCQQIISREINLLEERQHGNSKAVIDNYMENLKKQIQEDQLKFGSNMKKDAETSFSKLKEEIYGELSKIYKGGNSRDCLPNGKEEDKEKLDEHDDSFIEDHMKNKIQSEMSDMKERIRQDFSREVKALEDEIEALRKNYDIDSRGYTTDEGLGLSRSRLRLTEESSDDELDRILKFRHKKLHQRRFMSRASRNFDSDSDNSGAADFTRNMRQLMRRVDALETRFVPSASSGGYLHQPRHHQHHHRLQYPVLGQGLMSAPSSYRPPPAYSQVDEQLNQTKQWLKQRTLNLN